MKEMNENFFSQVHIPSSQSVWNATAAIPSYPPLIENKTYDVCIVGGGIAGLTTAYLLMKEGKKVCVIEANQIGAGQTGQTTAHLSFALDNRYCQLEKIHGIQRTRLIAQSHQAAIQQIANIIETERINCDFEKVNGYLFAGPSQSTDVLISELEASHRAGLLMVQTLAKAPLRQFDTGVALCFPDQYQFHPLKYIKALAKKINDRVNSDVYGQTYVTEIAGGEKALVKTREGWQITADAVVVATHTPINNTYTIHTKQAPYRSYVLGLTIPRGSLEKGLFWDTEEPFHYFRVHSYTDKSDILIVGGEDHKTGQNAESEKIFHRLLNWTLQRFPMCKELLYHWSGQIMESVDGLAFLGRNPSDQDNVYVITGDSGNGMTHATIGAMIIRDLILDRKNAWTEVYNPSRLRLRSMDRFFKENVNVLSQYKDWFSSPSSEVIRTLPRGEGITIHDGLEPLAVFRNEHGGLQMYSAVCPHLAGVVHWNPTEKSWDCPCHGSRFNCDGRVIEGPASRDLAPKGAQAELFADSASTEDQTSGTGRILVPPLATRRAKGVL